MQRFEFSLEKVLEWRATRLRQEEAKLAALRHQKDAMLRLRAAIETAAGQNATVIPARSLQITGAELSLLGESARSMKSRLTKIAAQIRECDARIGEQTRAVMDAEREKQLLEALRETQREEWAYELNREIEAAATELFLGRWKPDYGKPR
jgi:flagellar export protein FliJ